MVGKGDIAWPTLESETFSGTFPGRDNRNFTILLIQKWQGEVLAGGGEGR